MQCCSSSQFLPNWQFIYSPKPIFTPIWCLAALKPQCLKVLVKVPPSGPAPGRLSEQVFNCLLPICPVIPLHCTGRDQERSRNPMEEDVAVSSDLECAVTLSISKAPWAVFRIKIFSRNSPFRVQFTYLTRCNVSGAVEEATSNSIKSIQMSQASLQEKQ